MKHLTPEKHSKHSPRCTSRVFVNLNKYSSLFLRSCPPLFFEQQSPTSGTHAKAQTNRRRKVLERFWRSSGAVVGRRRKRTRTNATCVSGRVDIACPGDQEKAWTSKPQKRPLSPNRRHADAQNVGVKCQRGAWLQGGELGTNALSPTRWENRKHRLSKSQTETPTTSAWVPSVLSASPSTTRHWSIVFVRLHTGHDWFTSLCHLMKQPTMYHNRSTLQERFLLMFLCRFIDRLPHWFVDVLMLRKW